MVLQQVGLISQIAILCLFCRAGLAIEEEDLFADYWSIPLEHVETDSNRDGFMSAAVSGPAQLLAEPDAHKSMSHRQRTTTGLLFTHRDFHFASVVHAAHRSRDGGLIPYAQFSSSGEQLAEEGPVSLPVIPKSPPVCSQPPAMRFCKNVAYPVYRPSAEHTFAQLDFDSHAVFKKIAPHMRISERHFNLSDISECRVNFRQFLCLRNFPRCCHIGLCSEYGAPEPALTADSLSDDNTPSPPGGESTATATAAATGGGGGARGGGSGGGRTVVRRDRATKVTFVNGSKDIMKVQLGRNDTVKVKVADAVCLQYVKTYMPLFDCRTQCTHLLSSDCQFMLDEDCEALCYGVHSESCASKELYQIATGRSSTSPAGPRPAPPGPAALALLAAAVSAVAAAAAGGGGGWLGGRLGR